MFNWLKTLFRSDPPPTHKIVQCETKLLDSAHGPKHCIMIAADLNVPAALDTLVGELIERFKLHRMISSPDTSLMLVTIVGPCEPADFVSRWQKKVESDQIATVWMKLMEKADLGVAPAKGAVIPVFYSLPKVMTGPGSRRERRILRLKLRGAPKISLHTSHD